MIEIPEVRVRSLKISIQDGSDGPYPKGLIEIRGKLTEDLAKDLDILSVYKSEVEEFRISRDTLCEMGDADQAHSLTLHYLNGRGQALALQAVSLHAIVAKKTDGAWILHVKAAFDSRYGRAVSDFFWLEASFYGSAQLAPTQESLHFAPEAEE